MTAILTAKSLLRLALGLANLVLATVFLVGFADAGEPFVDREGRPVGGYDVVSYHTEDMPLQGRESITADFNGVTWFFASEANRDLFVANPARYAPAYDGHCAYALANDRKVRSDPLAYRVVDEVLYMNFSPDIQERWERDIPGYLEQSEANWPAHEDEPAARPSRWF
ncbi:YHS domain-containing (seleno)protein [Maricaulis sp.]|uniref:YHS domain-containing (seleno)protein n=1 Tax=Maricaulis sp. TaxID=1486257 RepID=UPI0025C42AC3|nr:YHS domain-containing (seleno)protein [Maricaulis sp.]